MAATVALDLGRFDPTSRDSLGQASVPDRAAVGALQRALRARDGYTSGHSGRVSAYSVAIAQELGVAEIDLSNLLLGAALHDIGKIGVPAELLRRDSTLSDEEFRLIQQHPVIGQRILAPLFGDRPMILAIARSHHERIDGRGYPDGLRGDDIPLAARIVAVADAFDAMTVARPYRSPLSVDRAVRELLRVAGGQLDPTCVKAFLTVLARHGVIAIGDVPRDLSPNRGSADTRRFGTGLRRRVYLRPRRAGARAPPAVMSLPP